MLPSEHFHNGLVQGLLDLRSGCKVLTGPPGAGKSTYVSYLYRELQKQGVPVVRHHYFLAIGDRTGLDRLDHHRAAESLMCELQVRYPDGLGKSASKNPDPSELGEWIERCGRYYADQGKALIILVDGLDHVRREMQSVDELRRLLGDLLPPPDGVVVLLATQPVDVTLLPPSVSRSAPREEWLELPLLSESSVGGWLRSHLEEFVSSHGKTLPDDVLTESTSMLHRNTDGHPLLLRYTLRALQERGIPVTPENIRGLPGGGPHGDVEVYYRELWQSLPELGREILHLLAACRFPWPRRGVLDCLSISRALSEVNVALGQVEHLLLEGDLGLRPFHSSLLMYIAGLPDHEVYQKNLCSIALRWLREEAPEYWRWAYEWRIQADLGDDAPLREGPSREWAVQAIARRCIPDELVALLDQGTLAALHQDDLPRAVELGLWREYSREVYKIDDGVMETLLRAQLVIEDDPHLRRRLLSNLRDLSDGEVFLLAEAEAANEQKRSVGRCYNELLTRAVAHRLGERKGVYDEHDGKDEPLVRVTAMRGAPGPQQVLHWVMLNRESGYSRGFVRVLGEQLRATRDVQWMRLALSSPSQLEMGASVTESTDDSMYGTPRLLEAERDLLLQHAALLAMEEGAELRDILVEPQDKSNPFVVLYLTLGCNTGPQSPPEQVAISFPSLAAFDDDGLQREPGMDSLHEFYHRCFFCLLANYMLDRQEANSEWLATVGTSTWARRFVSKLDEAASAAAERLRGGDALSFDQLYDTLSALRRPERPQERSAIAIQHGNMAAHSAIAIALDLPALTVATGTEWVVSREDLEDAFASGYCHPDAWVSAYVARRRPWLNPDVVRWLLDSREAELKAVREPFRERAGIYSSLASLAVLHGLKECACAYVYDAANNLLAHGSHKDTLFFETLEVVRLAHSTKGGSMGSEGDGSTAESEAVSWLLRLAPPIAAIREYTDGDETGHLPRELADVLPEMSPVLLPPYYRWLCEGEEYYNALHAFRVLLATMDLRDPVNLAIAKTAVDPQELRILESRAQNGDEVARAVLESSLSVLEADALRMKREDEPRPDDLPAYREGRSRVPPSPDEFPPERFDYYLAELRERTLGYLMDGLDGWITYWKMVGRGEDVLVALERAVDRGDHLRVHDALFDLTLEFRGRQAAYQHLVLAHADNNGWHRYWTDKGQAVRRWKEMRRRYTDEWLYFISDTTQHILLSRGWSIGPQWWARLVEYSIYMGHGDVAQEIARRVVERSLELVSPLELPMPDWVDFR